VLAAAFGLALNSAPGALSIAISSVSPGGAALSVASDTPGPVLVQAASGLGPMATWQMVGQVAGGSGAFTDTSAWGAPSRYYRARYEGLFSTNVAGWYRATARIGATAVVNQFIRSDNTVAAMFPNVPTGFTVYTVGPEGYEANTFLGSWTQPDQRIALGEACVLYNPGPEFLGPIFLGTVPEGRMIQALHAGYLLCGSMVPVSGAVSSTLGYPAAAGDEVLRVRRTDNYFDLAGYFDGVAWYSAGGNPTEPSFGVADAFWIHRQTGTLWVFPFSVAGGGGNPIVQWDPPQMTNTVGRVNSCTWNSDAGRGRVYDVDGVTPLRSNFRAQLYAGMTRTEGALTPVGSPVSFLGGEMGGYINAGAITIPGATSWDPVYFQLRAWEGARGATYEAALTNRSKTGRSGVVSVDVGPPALGAQSGGVAAPVNGFTSFPLSAAPTIKPSQLTFENNHQVRLDLDVPPGVRVIFEAGSTLDQFGTILNVVSSGTTMTIRDPASVNAPARFYRMHFTMP